MIQSSSNIFMNINT